MNLLLPFKDDGNLEVYEQQLTKTLGSLSFRLFAGFFFYVFPSISNIAYCYGLNFSGQ